MSVKTILHPSGKTFCLGRVRPRRGLRVRLRDYLTLAQLPPAPSSTDYSVKALPVLADVFGNDRLGDCTVAGAYHVIGVETGNAGDLFHASEAQIISDYSAIGGYVPGDSSTDQGCDEISCFDYWTQTGFADGTKLAGYATVDATNPQEVMSALYLFENLYFGLSLPDAWINPTPDCSGFVWDVEGDPDPANGHCIIGCGYGPDGINISTWGMLGKMTWPALAKYCTEAGGGELYVLLTPDQLSRSATVAPNGIAWADLQADLQILNKA
jgi:hypothetical protein